MIETAAVDIQVASGDRLELTVVAVSGDQQELRGACSRLQLNSLGAITT
jgi:hypothetical protein